MTFTYFFNIESIKVAISQNEDLELLSLFLRFFGVFCEDGHELNFHFHGMFVSYILVKYNVFTKFNTEE